jgi:4-carboxymuconolactone decarboxylase
MTDNTTPATELSPTAQLIGDFAPKMVDLTDNVLFADVWARPELSPRDRSLVTIIALTAGGNAGQLPYHLNFGKDNGLTETEIVEALTHAAFYVGWPKAMTAITTAKDVFSK